MSNLPETARLPVLFASGMRTRRDDARLRALVDQHMDLASRIIRNLGIPDCDVDDLLQQAFSITADRLGDITAGKERAFLIQTAIRLAASARRAHARSRETLTGELPEVSDGRPTPEDLSDQAQTLRMLDRVLANMDLDLRAVFVLYEIEEVTMAEIATVLQIPAGTVASRLRRAREDFLARVRRLGVGEQVRQNTRAGKGRLP
jgi:RNA polymerase sigma-70 factor (ECF subfamily)